MKITNEKSDGFQPYQRIEIVSIVVAVSTITISHKFAPLESFPTFEHCL